MGGVIGFANAALYIASKHAVLGLIKTASIEWFRQGVLASATIGRFSGAAAIGDLARIASVAV
jgi:NAD(P)-dependent dehydrogenase (short-subunit alcohol dehydrogenase family)